MGDRTALIGEQMDKLPPIVEVAVNSDCNRVPLGLMNAEQAHPLRDPGARPRTQSVREERAATETFISKDELLKPVSEEEP
jgi:hypothetical protein